MVTKTQPNSRTQFLLSGCSIFFMCLSGLYCLLLLWGYLRLRESYQDFSPLLGSIVFLLSFISYLLNKKGRTNFSLLVLSTTILSVCTLAGVWWGFDLPSTLLGYVASIVIVAVTGSKRENSIHLVSIFLLMSVGHIYRTIILQNTITWRGTDFILNDLVEIFIIFGFITILLIFSNREQQKLLDRSTRSEYMLKRERDTLEVKVDERTKEIKQLQMDHIGELYRFVEFGKLSSGLFHDLISPVQALKIYTDASKQKDMEPAVAKQFANIQSISEKIERMLQAMRTQIRIDSQAEDFDVLSDIRDIVQMTRYLHLKHNIDIDVLCETDTYEVTTKRTILNHVLLNLISNACEACIPQSRERECRILIRVGPNTGAELRHYISIEDTGVGIAEKDLQKIFDPFFTTKQADKQIDTKQQTINCGIGLSSSKHAIQKQLQGKLYVESELGVGTTMTILF